MRNFLKNAFVKKMLSVIILVIILCNTFMPIYSFGWTIGGVVYKPIVSAAVTFIDAINAIIGVFLGGVGDTIESISKFDIGGALTKHLASPEYIFAGFYPILNANIFKDNSIPLFNGINENVRNELTDIWNGFGTTLIGKLRTSIAGIYIVLRNICAVILLCILIYIGIRIVLSSAFPEEQAKWKGYIVDWIKSLGLLIFMHLIMITLFNISDSLAGSLASSLTGESSITNLVRQYSSESWDEVAELISVILYGYVTYLTIIFAFAYFKRVIWTAILIVIAPIVAALYAIGGEGKNIYKRWFKEFTVNCMIQPFQIIIFYVLILIPLGTSTSAGNIELNLTLLSQAGAIVKFIYCLVALSLIRPAERFIRNLFGVNGGIANTASFESGKQFADSVGNAIKQAIMTTATIATGAATLGAGVATGQIGNAEKGMKAIMEKAKEGSLNGESIGNTPLMDIPLDNDAMNEELLNSELGTHVIDNGIKESNGTRILTKDAFKNDELSEEKSINAGTLKIIGAATVNNESNNVSGGVNSSNVNTVNNESSNQRVQEENLVKGISETNGERKLAEAVFEEEGISDRSLGSIMYSAHEQNEENQEQINRKPNERRGLAEIFSNSLLSSPEKVDATFDIIDSLSQWKHIMGDVGRSIGDLGGGPGHPPIRMAPFLRGQAKNRLVEQERMLNEAAERFAADGNIHDYFYRVHFQEYHDKYIGRCTKDGIVDEELLKEYMKNEAKDAAKKASEYVKFGYMDVVQINEMMKMGSEARKSRTEDVVQYYANYQAVQNAMINAGTEVNGTIVKKETAENPEIKQAIKESLKYLEQGQNVAGAQIDIRLSQNESIPRISAKELTQLVNIGNELDSNGIKVSKVHRRDDIKSIHSMIEAGKREGIQKIEDKYKSAEALPEKVREFINTKLDEGNGGNGNS